MERKANEAQQRSRKRYLVEVPSKGFITDSNYSTKYAAVLPIRTTIVPIEARRAIPGNICTHCAILAITSQSVQLAGMMSLCALRATMYCQ